jgi:tubulin polyglutamylase TTLL6/13
MVFFGFLNMQGKGVALAQSGSDVRAAIEGLSGSDLLAQKYVANPMLINGYKFDLRIYVLILSCDPLRLYLYRFYF